MKRKEYKVDARAKKVALFFLACERNPVTRISIPAAMRAKGYSDLEAADQILVQQVRRESQKNKSNDSPRPDWLWRRQQQRGAAGWRYELSPLAPQMSAVKDDASATNSRQG